MFSIHTLLVSVLVVLSGVFANNKNIGLIFIAWFECVRERVVARIVPPFKAQVEKENIFLI